MRTPVKEEVIYWGVLPSNSKSIVSIYNINKNNVINLLNERVYQKNLIILLIKFKMKTLNDKHILQVKMATTHVSCQTSLMLWTVS